MKKMRGVMRACRATVILLAAWGCDDKENPVFEPVIVSVSPLKGVAGSEVIITGEYLRRNVAFIDVFFNGIRADVLYSNDDQIVTRVPDFASTGELTIESTFRTEIETGTRIVSAGIFHVPAGGIDHSFNGKGTGASSTISKMRTLPDGKIIVAGSFTNYNGILSPLIAKLNEDGTLDESFNADRPSYGIYVRDFDVAPDGSIILTGAFEYDGGHRFEIARLFSDGARDINVLRGSGPTDGDIFSVAVQKDGKILLGGDFENYYYLNAGSIFTPTIIIPRSNLLRLNEDFSLDESFDPGQGFDGLVKDIHIMDNGDIMVAGAFSTYNGQPVNDMVLLHPDGSISTGFSAGNGFDGGDIRQLLSLPDGKWLIAGTFKRFQGANVPGLIRLHADGSHDSSFDLLISHLGNLSMAVDGNGNLALGGTFSIEDGKRKNLAIVDCDGNLLSFDSGSTFSTDGPTALTFDKENHLLIDASKHYEYKGIFRNGPFRVLTSD